jgi:hypothetical protein
MTCSCMSCRQLPQLKMSSTSALLVFCIGTFAVGNLRLNTHGVVYVRLGNVGCWQRVPYGTTIHIHYQGILLHQHHHRSAWSCLRPLAAA